jgi:hypothetical protein
MFSDSSCPFCSIQTPVPIKLPLFSHRPLLKALIYVQDPLPPFITNPVSLPCHGY